MTAAKKKFRSLVSDNSTRKFLPYFIFVCLAVCALLCAVPKGFAEEAPTENFAFAQKKTAMPKGKATPTPNLSKTKAKATPTPAQNKAKPTSAPKEKAKPNPTPKKSAPKAKAKPTPMPKTAKDSAKSTPKPAVKSTPKPTAKSTPQPSRTTKTQAIITPNLAVRRYIVMESGAIVRSAPRLNGTEQTRLVVGTIVRAEDRTAKTENIGGKSNYWYQITPPKGKKGWTFGGNLSEFEGADTEDAVRRLVASYSNVEPTTFDQQVQLNELVTGVLPEVKNNSLAAELSLTRLLSLRASLLMIPSDRANFKPYSDWLRSQQAYIVYNEPAGEWIVRSQAFWDLHKKYRNVEPLAEKIAWKAAQNPLPGECEGYLNCYIYFLRTTQGEYLENYPNGAHTAEALKNIADGIAPIVADLKEKAVFNGPSDVSDRAEFYKLVSELRTSISRTTGENKRLILDRLNQIAEAYR